MFFKSEGKTYDSSELNVLQTKSALYPVIYATKNWAEVFVPRLFNRTRTSGSAELVRLTPERVKFFAEFFKIPELISQSECK